MEKSLKNKGQILEYLQNVITKELIIWSRMYLWVRESLSIQSWDWNVNKYNIIIFWTLKIMDWVKYNIYNCIWFNKINYVKIIIIIIMMT